MYKVRVKLSPKITVKDIIMRKWLILRQVEIDVGDGRRGRGRGGEVETGERSGDAYWSTINIFERDWNPL